MPFISFSIFYVYVIHIHFNKILFFFITARADNKKSAHIFLYTMVISDEYLAPIFSMLSEIHNGNFISYFLREFIRLGGSVPDEFVVDMSAALLNAAVIAFTSHLNLKSYINAVFDLNFASSPVLALPECFIRIDIAHFMKAIASCVHFANKKARVREMYVRCVALLLKETEIIEARKIIFSILVMANSETEGKHKYVLY